MSVPPSHPLVLNSFAIVIVHLIEQGIENLGGPGAQKAIVGSLSWADLEVIAFFLFLTLLINGFVAAFFRQKMKGQSANKELPHHYAHVLSKPIYLLIWTFGFYFACTPLLMKLSPDEGLILICGCLDQCLELIVLAVLLWLFLRFTRVLEIRLKEWTSKTPSRLDDLFVPLVIKGLRIIVPVLGVIVALPVLELPVQISEILAKSGSILLIVAIGIILLQLVNIAEKTVLAEYDIQSADNLRAREIYTRMHIISKTLYVLIILFAIASILMLFKQVQHFGASILASAGVVGIILGFAAQKMIANLFAGFQLAMAQPIRLDDVVIVEGEWGRIEEITLTYVIIHIWDDRRLVVPLSYFIEKPFQNWTRTSAALMGSVILWVDYTLPLDEIRRTLKGIIESHPLWDKRFWNLQVTDTSEHTMQIRVLATSGDSSKSWDLRCDIREKLISFLQEKYPQCLPRLRTDLFSVAATKETKSGG